MISRVPHRCVALTLVLLLAGCAAGHSPPLPRKPNLAAGLGQLRLTVPSETPALSLRPIEITRPLDTDEIGLIAILNDPDLLSERGEIAIARAALLQASLLPNPSVGLSYAAFISGPGTASAYGASVSQSIASIITYVARVKSAQAHVDEVNANLLWREWLVAQQSRLLALDIYWDGQSIGLNQRELALLSEELRQVRAAVAVGNLDLTALSPVLAAKASVEQTLAALNLKQLQNWQRLDGLLGLAQDVRFAITEPRLRPLPSQSDPLIASLPDRRPDLVALQLGYLSSDENARAAILGQFPPLVVGGAFTSDTTDIKSAGPTFTFDLPIFDRNQGRIANAQATSQLLYEQYQARLDRTTAHVRGLLAQVGQLSSDLLHARKAALSAKSLLTSAKAAFAQGNLDQRTLTEFETTALQRDLEVVTLKRGLGEAEITLTVELGIGLPTARLRTLDEGGGP